MIDNEILGWQLSGYKNLLEMYNARKEFIQITSLLWLNTKPVLIFLN